jgi:hypothetical protein
MENLVSVGVGGGAHEKPIDCGSLVRESLAAGLESLSKSEICRMGGLLHWDALRSVQLEKMFAQVKLACVQKLSILIPDNDDGMPWLPRGECSDVAQNGNPNPLLTLEPLLEAVQEGLTEAGWALSGLQKTTSFEFEGRWSGQSSRSAYLFFHRKGIPDWISIDVFLDETDQGLKGNMALVVEGPVLEVMGDPADVLSVLAATTATLIPKGYRTPLTLRYRLPRLGADVLGSETEIRIKLHIPGTAMDAGSSAVAALSTEAARSFLALLHEPAMRDLVKWGEPDA